MQAPLDLLQPARATGGRGGRGDLAPRAAGLPLLPARGGEARALLLVRAPPDLQPALPDQGLGWLAVPANLPPSSYFFYHSDARGLELLKAGAAACEQSNHTALKSVRAKRSLEPRPSCCDLRTKIRHLRGKGHKRCQTCLLTLPDEEQPGFSETVARLEKQPRIG